MWTYAKKAFVLLVIASFILYGGVFLMGYADSIKPHEEETPSPSGETFLIPPEQNGLEGLFLLVKNADFNGNLTVSAMNANIEVKVNGEIRKNVSYSSNDVKVPFEKGDKIEIKVTNPTDSPVPGSVMFLPSFKPPAIDNSARIGFIGEVLFLFSLLFYFGGLGYLYQLLRVERNMGKVVIEPHKQPLKIDKAEDYPLAECPNCHRRIPADSKICPYCGTKFDSSVAICGSCGKPIPADAVVCPYCGAKLR